MPTDYLSENIVAGIFTLFWSYNWIQLFIGDFLRWVKAPEKGDHRIKDETETSFKRDER